MSNSSKDFLNLFVGDPLNVHLLYRDRVLVPNAESSLESTINSIAQYVLENPLNPDEVRDLVVKIEPLEGLSPIALRLEKQLLSTFTQQDLSRLIDEGHTLLALKAIESNFQKEEHQPLLLTLFEHVLLKEPVHPEELALSLEILAHPLCDNPGDQLYSLLKTALECLETPFEIKEESFVELLRVFSEDSHFQQLLTNKMGDTREKTKVLFIVKRDPEEQAALLTDLVRKKDGRSIEYLFNRYGDQYFDLPLSIFIETTSDLEELRFLLSQSFIPVEKLSTHYFSVLNHATHCRELTALFVELGVPVQIGDLDEYLEQIITQKLDPLFNHLFSGKASKGEVIPKKLFFLNRYALIPEEYLLRIQRYYSPEAIQEFLASNFLEKEVVLTTWDPDFIKSCVKNIGENEVQLLVSNRLIDEPKLCHLLGMERLSDECIFQCLDGAFSVSHLKLFEELSLNHPELFAEWCQVTRKSMSVFIFKTEIFFPIIDRLIEREPLFIEILKRRENLLVALAHTPYQPGYLRKILGAAPFPYTDSMDFALEEKDAVLDLLLQGGLHYYYQDGSNIFHRLAEMGFSVTETFNLIEELLSNPFYRVTQDQIADMLNEEDSDLRDPFEVFFITNEDFLTIDQLRQFQKYGYQFDIGSCVRAFIESNQFKLLEFFGEASFVEVQNYLNGINLEGDTNYIALLKKQENPDVVAGFESIMQCGLKHGIVQDEQVWDLLKANDLSENRTILGLLLQYPEETKDLFEVALQSDSAPALVSFFKNKDLLARYKEQLASLIGQLDVLKRNYLVGLLFDQGIAWEELFDNSEQFFNCVLGLYDNWIYYLVSKGYRFPTSLIFDLLKGKMILYQLTQLIVRGALKNDLNGFLKEFMEQIVLIRHENIEAILECLIQEALDPLLDHYIAAPDSNQRSKLFYYAVLFKGKLKPLFDKLIGLYIESWKRGDPMAKESLAVGIFCFNSCGEDLNFLYNINPDFFLQSAITFILDASQAQFDLLFNFINSKCSSQFIEVLFASDISPLEQVMLLEKLEPSYKGPLAKRWIWDKEDHSELFRAVLHREPTLFQEEFIQFELSTNQQGALRILAEEFTTFSFQEITVLMGYLSNEQKFLWLDQLSNLTWTMPVMFKILTTGLPVNMSRYLLEKWVSYRDDNGDTLFFYAVVNGKWDIATQILGFKDAALGGVNRQGYSVLDYLVNAVDCANMVLFLFKKGAYDLGDLKRSLDRVPIDRVVNFIIYFNVWQDLSYSDALVGVLGDFLKTNYPRVFENTTFDSLGEVQNGARFIQQFEENRYQIDRAHYAVEIPTVEIPMMDPTRADIHDLNKFFEKYVPREVVTLDGPLRLTYQDLKSRLALLLDYIDREQHVAPLPLDPTERYQEYEKLKNIYRNLIVQWEQISDADLLRSSMIEIAKGGPPYCATKWFSEATFLLEELLKDPNHEMTIDLEIHSMVAELYRGIFFELVQEINGTVFEESPGNHLHTPVQLFYLLRPDANEPIAPEGRGIRLNQEVKEDVFGPDWTRGQAVEAYDRKCTPLRIIQMVQQRLNGFDMPLIKRNLIEDWLVEHVFSREQFELSATELQKIGKTLEQIQRNRAGAKAIEKPVLELLLQEEGKDRALLVELLVELVPGAQYASFTSLNEKTAFEALMSALLLNTPYEGGESDTALVEQIKQSPGLDETLTNWIVKGCILRLQQNMGLSAIMASAQVGRLKMQWAEFLKDAAFREALFSYFVTGDTKQLIDRWVDLESAGAVQGAIVALMQREGIPLTTEKINQWLSNPVIDNLSEMIVEALKMQKIQQLKEQLYETYPVTGNLKHYDRNNFLIEPDYQMYVPTRAHLKEEYLVWMLQYLKILTPN